MTDLDWTVMELERVGFEVKKQAGSVAVNFPTYMSAEDLEQEAVIYCASNADWIRECNEKPGGLLGMSIWRALRDKVRTEARHQGNTIGIHRLYEDE